MYRQNSNSIFTINLTQHVIYIVCAAILTVLVTSTTYSQTVSAKSVQGDDAINQLKQEGSFDSLIEAVRTAQMKSGQTEAVNSSTYRQAAKLIGSDTVPGEGFGTSVSLSGNTVIVGSYRDDVGSNVDQGSAYIFVRNGLSWTEQAHLIASDGSSQDSFGDTVAVSGDIVVIGACNDDVGLNSDQGSVYVFTRTSGTWSEQAHLTAADGAAVDRFGLSVAISGNTAVIGATLNDIGANVDQGSAYVFVSDGVNWTQQTMLIAADGAASDQFGGNVAISGDTAVVGAASDDIGANTNQGSVYVFTRNGTTWTPEAKLNASDGASGDTFGSRVANSGDTLIAGARSDDIGSNPNQGSAYVFVRVGTVWTEQAKLLAMDGATNDNFGSSVGISGDTVVIGASSDSVCSKNAQGSAFIYARTGSTWTQQAHLTAADGVAGQQLTWNIGISGDTVIAGTVSSAAYVFQLSKHNWMEEAKAIASDGTAGDYFGGSAAISGNTAIIGADYDDVTFPDQGSAYVFVRKGHAWIQQAQLTASDATANDHFGGVVAIDGDTAVISGRTSVYVFVRSGSVWIEQAKLTASDGQPDDQFGSGIGIYGDTVVVGSFWDDIGSNGDQGSAYIFTRTGTTWTQTQKLIASDGAAGDALGFSVGIYKDTVVAGASGDDITFSAQGSAYIFVRNGPTWTQEAKLVASDAATLDFFGVRVGISGDTIVVGANHDDVAFTDQGSAYVFVRNGSSWTEQAKLVASDAEAGDDFSESLSISGDVIIVGAPFKGFTTGVGGSHEGTAYVYQRKGTTWTEVKLLASDAGTGDYFGWGVGVSANTVVIGSRYSTTTALEQGAAYLFELNHTPFDFNNDGSSDLTVFRPSEKNWYVETKATCDITGVKWGLETDKLAPADYDGDGVADIAVWREEALANFYIYNSSDDTMRTEQFGQTGDILTVGDWDGDGRADPAVYRDSAYGTQNYFFYRGSMENPNGDETYLPWGSAGDKPMPGDFDGDGKMDAAVFRPSDNTWYIRQSSDGQIKYESWGLSTDRFVPADYDGDGKTDLAVFRDGTWYIRQSSNGQVRYETLGLNTDTLVPADYDGDGKIDVAVYRAGEWYILRSTDGVVFGGQWGMAGDIPAAAAYLP